MTPLGTIEYTHFTDEGLGYRVSIPDNAPLDTRFCGCYSRISSDPTLQGLGVERQVEELVARAHGQGLVPIVYEDNDITSTRRDLVRKHYERMVADVTSGKLYTVMSRDTARLFRRPFQSEMFIELMEELDMAPLQFLDGGEIDIHDHNGQAMFRVLGAFNAKTVAENKANLRRAFVQRANKGRHGWTHTPFGYNRGNVDGTGATINEEQAAAIRQAYDDVLHRRPMTQIARSWNAAGHKTVFGNPWNNRSLREFLLNPRNAGIRVHQTYKQTKNGRQLVSERVIDKPAEWPPIVERDIFEGARALLRANPGPSNAFKRKHLLSGMIICGKCGSKCLTSSPKGRTNYQCQRPGCHGVSRNLQCIDQLTRGVVLNYLADQKAIERKLDSGINVTKLRARLAELDGIERELAAALQGGMSFSALAPQQEAITAERARIDTELATKPHRAKPLEGVLNADDVEKVWDAMDQDEQRAVIDVLFTITILVGQKTGRAPFDPQYIRFEPKL